MSFYGRHSIDNIPGFPIIVEDFVIPVFKGSTLTTEFQFPFVLENSDVISVTDAEPEDLINADIVRVNSDTISITWPSEIIEDLQNQGNSFRVRVDRADGTVKVYNKITIRIF